MLIFALRKMSMDKSTVNMANYYKLYLNGFAYIPLQDIGRYQKAYEQVYGKEI